MRTLVGVVLDRSGSMLPVADDTIGGFNSFIETQRAGDFDQVYVVTQFDHEYNVMQENVPLADVVALSRENYIPRGSTALLDALGRTISTLDAILTADESINQALLVVITDGAENASKEFTRKQVFELISTREDSGNWAFNFLAANQDAIATGAQLGLRAASCMNYASTPEGTKKAFTRVTRSASLYSGGGSADLES